MSKLIELLEELEEYFGDRADADHNGQRFVPNLAMKYQMQLQEAIAYLEKSEAQK